MYCSGGNDRFGGEGKEGIGQNVDIGQNRYEVQG